MENPIFLLNVDEIYFSPLLCLSIVKLSESNGKSNRTAENWSFFFFGFLGFVVSLVTGDFISVI